MAYGIFRSILNNSQLPQAGTGHPSDVFFVNSTGLLWFIEGSGNPIQLLASVPIPTIGPQGPKGDTGNVGPLFTSIIQFSGDWSSIVEYKIGETVNSNNFLWLCTTANIGNSPSTPGSLYWQVLAPTAFSSRPFSLVVVCDGAGSAPPIGVKGTYVLPFAATIVSWSLIADQPSSATFDILASSFAAFPSGAQSIVNGDYPNLSTEQTNEGTPAVWSTVTFVAETVIEFSLLNVTDANFLTLTLTLKPSD